MTEFGLAGAFRTEDIEDWKELGLRYDNVTEERGEQESSSNFCVITKDTYQLLHILAQGHGSGVAMHETTFELIQLRIVLVDGGRSG